MFKVVIRRKQFAVARGRTRGRNLLRRVFDAFNVRGRKNVNGVSARSNGISNKTIVDSNKKRQGSMVLRSNDGKRLQIIPNRFGILIGDTPCQN